MSEPDKISRAAHAMFYGRHPRTEVRAVLSAFASPADPSSRAYYDRRRGQRQRHNAALFCLARRQINALFAMLRNRTPHQLPASTEPDAGLAVAENAHGDIPTLQRLTASRWTSKVYSPNDRLGGVLRADRSAPTVELEGSRWTHFRPCAATSMDS